MFDKPNFEPPTQSEIHDWEYKPSRTGVAGETKFAVAIVTMLMVAFGYIVWNKLDPTHGQIMAQSNEQLKPFVFGQTPEEEPEPLPTHAKPLPAVAESNPFLAEAEPTPAPPITQVEANPFATPKPEPQTATEPAPPQDFFASELPAIQPMAPAQPLPQPEQLVANEPESVEPTPLNIAQAETAESNPFFSPVERGPNTTVAKPVQTETEPTPTLDLFATTEEPKPVPTENVFMSVERPQFASVNDPKPAPFQPSANIQTIASDETKPQPDLKEPSPFAFAPTPAPESEPEEVEEEAVLPSFEPLVLPQDDVTPPPTKPTPVPMQPLPSFGDFTDPEPQPLPAEPKPIPPAQGLPAFSPTPTVPPTFEAQAKPPLNQSGNRMTVQRDETVIPPQGNFAKERIYEVQEGDNYWAISRKMYGKARYFSSLAEYNKHRIPRPDRMKPGMKVLIPDTRLLAQKYPKMVGIRVVDNTNTPAPVDSGVSGFFVDASGQPMYRIGKGDTLTDIAQNHLGRSTRWVQIYGMNQNALKDANTLKIGTVLRLPRDASQVARAPQ